MALPFKIFSKYQIALLGVCLCESTLVAMHTHSISLVKYEFVAFPFQEITIFSKFLYEEVFRIRKPYSSLDHLLDYQWVFAIRTTKALEGVVRIER